MARAIATCTCKHCGKTFEKVKFCANRTEADSFEAWAKDNCNECPDCFKARMQKMDDEFYAKYQLPEIKGVSEKQVAYAESLRKKLIVSYKADSNFLDRIPKIVKDLESDKFKEVADAHFDGDIEKAKTAYFSTRKSTYCLVVAFTESDARTIIEALKSY